MRYEFDKTPLSGEIHDFREAAQIHKVDETSWEKFWDDLVNTYHYLGYESVVGARVKYIVTLGNQIVGAISFCAAAYHLGNRDNYIGWDQETRVSMLPHLVSNNRFLILPWINIKNLASHVLSESLQQLRIDWEKQYEVVPYMVETFVDREHFLGTCYRAANWTFLGVTKGYGKVGKGFVYHGRPKDLYVYIMDRRFARRFKPEISRVYNEREELAAMINGIPMWYPSLLKECGIPNNPAELIKQRFVDHLLPLSSFLGRKEHKQHLVSMVQGLLSDLKRKSIEPIATAFEGVDGVRNLTNFMSKSKWDAEGMLEEYQRDLSRLISHEDGMITGDDTSFPKKGQESVGVARQYCGSTGKVDNCQVGVMVGYASAHGYGIVDYELFMPQSWFDGDNAHRRQKCKVPQDIKPRSKNEMLSEMINEVYASGMFPAKYVGVDAGYGIDGQFLDSLPDGVIYFAGMRSNSLVFAERPEITIPPYSGRGRRFTKPRPSASPMRVEDVVALSDVPWERVVLGIGAKGPVFAEDRCLRVVELRDHAPGKDVWLYARRIEDGSIKYALCNAPADASWDDIRKPALMRWSIEQCFQECKSYLGMDHCEARSWVAWRRHILLTLIAHLFIIKLRIEFSRTPNAPGTTPYVENPVSLDDYLVAHDQMLTEQRIDHPSIMLIPKRPQQFMSIGAIQILITASFPKIGLVMQKIDQMLYKAKSSFDSHSLAKIHQVRTLYDALGTT